MSTEFCWPILLADKIGQLYRSSDIPLSPSNGVWPNSTVPAYVDFGTIWAWKTHLEASER